MTIKAFTPEMISAAKRCLVAQLQRWDAERELESLLVPDGELNEMEQDIKGICACLDEPEDVDEEDALELLGHLVNRLHAKGGVS